MHSKNYRSESHQIPSGLTSVNAGRLLTHLVMNMIMKNSIYFINMFMSMIFEYNYGYDFEYDNQYNFDEYYYVYDDKYN